MGRAECDLGTDCLCTPKMSLTCEFRLPAPGDQRPAPEPLRPADRFTVAVVALCTGVGFLAGALFSRIVA